LIAFSDIERVAFDSTFSPMALPSIGEIWDGKYRIDRVLGEGGMGVVFEAYHLRLEQQVAIKCLLAEFADNVAVKARFEREARAAARLRSRHVVKILDVETHPSGMPYMVMELMHGCDLDNENHRRGDIPYPELCDWLVQAAGALAEAHKAGIVHRDLKPSNIFIAEEPGERMAKVLDFGIAKSTAIMPGITYSTAGGGGICGTPQYMSPEQITDSDVDGRADIWALGVVAYELLAKRAPFEAQSFTALAVKIANSVAPDLQTIRPDLPHALAAAVMRTLRKDRNARFATMLEFAEALAPFGTRTDLLRWSKPQLSFSSSPSLSDIPSAPSLPISGSLPVPSVSVRASANTLLGQTLVDGKSSKSKTYMIAGGFALAIAAVGAVGAVATFRPKPVPVPAAVAPLATSAATVPPPLPSAIELPAVVVPSSTASASASTVTSAVRPGGLKVAPPSRTAPSPSGRPPIVTSTLSVPSAKSSATKPAGLL
jgi:eukaryotic-like serine/threonine-protein kinase